MGMEYDPNVPSRQPDVRASDVERAQTIELLRCHHEGGRLTAEELAERTERVNAAMAFGDLDATMANLPRLLPPLPPSTAPAQERTPISLRRYVLGSPGCCRRRPPHSPTVLGTRS
jgi:hypothetical protein